MEYEIRKGNIELGVLGKGAELVSLKKDGTEFMWERDPKFWGKSSPVLFPFVGSIKDGKYKYNGKEYSMETRHGFARDNDFELVEKGEDFLKFLLKSNEATLEKYPFNFELYLTYKIENENVDMIYEVVNPDKDEMYFSIGAHPAFATPVSEEIKLEDYYLELNEKETASIYQNEEALLIREKKVYLENESIINLGEHVFDNDAIIFKGLNSNEVTIKCKKSSRELKVKYDNFPYIAFWSVPKAPFVCIEPWYGKSDFTDASGELTEKEGIEKVKDRFTAKLSISMKV
ncbi:MAG: aldose 1-epimerase family protein [Fusobacteriales bacterium]|jgi:galactose mutarotase-like enzyme|nr:aldose 1-epimerase family protein [Fusobacteriales bacterium]